MSKKYVIEIKPEYEDSFKGLMLLGAKDSNLFVDALAVEDLEELNADYINENYGSLQDEAYQRGLEEGKKAFDLLESGRISEYEQGLNDSWEAAKKISLMSPDEIEKVFPGAAKYNRFNLGYSGVEAIAKLKVYEEQKADDKIEVGDTVNLKDGSRDNDGIVTKSWDNDRHFIMWADGSGGVWDKEYIVKTGRHFDIDKILEEMRND